jgi:choline dehydrogenase
MIIAPQPESNPFWQVVRDAALEAGYAAVGDLNAPEAEGVGWLDVNVAEGVRQSAADAYLRPALDRPGLTVATGALVTGLIVRGGHCAGVRYTVDGREQTAYASAEVILTAGVIGSPQLLQLSGIGPADHLRSLGIQVACDLPGVGENLQDHPQTGVAYITTRPAQHATYARKPAVVLRSGPGRKTADLQFIFIDRPIVPRGRPLSDDGYTLAVSLMTPDSRGRVRLRSSDPAAAPSIDLSLLTAAGDVERLVAGLRLARVIGEAHALDDWRKAERAPGPAVTDDTGLADYVRHSATSYFHAAGTCRMGEDNGAVVDSLLRVRGVTGLRVADASVMPTVVSANTNATVLAVAERAADLILRA